MSKLAKIVVIFPELVWPVLEHALLQHHVKGLSLSPVRGFGDYVNFYSRDLLCDSLKLEIYTTMAQARPLAQFIASFLKAQNETGGLVAIEPVAEVLNIRLEG